MTYARLNVNARPVPVFGVGIRATVGAAKSSEVYGQVKQCYIQPELTDVPIFRVRGGRTAYSIVDEREGVRIV